MLWKNVHSANLIRAFMLVVPGVLVIGPVVLLTVAPHANLHLLFLVPAIAHIYLLTTPCIHGLRTCCGKVRQRKTLSINAFYIFNIVYLFLKFIHKISVVSSYMGVNSFTAWLDARVRSITIYMWSLTHRTYAGHPSHNQIHGSLCSVLPSWSWCPLAFPRQMCHCPPSLVEQCQDLPMKIPSFERRSHPILQEKW